MLTHASIAGSQSSPPAHVELPARHAFVVSSQTSLPLHAMPSEQLRALPPQLAPAHTSLSVQNSPSSQLAPAFALHALRVVATAQTSH